MQRNVADCEIREIRENVHVHVHVYIKPEAAQVEVTSAFGNYKQLDVVYTNLLLLATVF